MAAYCRVYDSRHLQADCHRCDQLRNPTLGNRVWATFTFFNTTVCASTSIQFRRAGQRGPTRTLTAASKTCNKTVTGYIFYHTSKILQTNKKTRKINLFNAVPNTFKDVKFTVDGSAFQTYITVSTKNFCIMLAMHLGLNS